MEHLQCQECKKKFRRAGNLGQHVLREHPGQFLKLVPMEKGLRYKCPHCDVGYKNYSSRQKHILTKHTDSWSRKKEKDGTDFVCYECTATFNNFDKFIVHVKQEHPEKMDIMGSGVDNLIEIKKQMATINKPFTCSQCYERFKTKQGLTIHKNKSHTKRLKDRLEKCPLCNLVTTLTDINTHFEEQHSIQLEYDELEFNSTEDFHAWKEELEALTSSTFIKKTNISPRGRVTLVCNRSGPIQNSTRTIKINGFCPAGLYVTNYLTGDRVKVQYCKTHVGHEYMKLEEHPKKDSHVTVVSEFVELREKLVKNFQQEVSNAKTFGELEVIEEMLSNLVAKVNKEEKNKFDVKMEV